LGKLKDFTKQKGLKQKASFIFLMCDNPDTLVFKGAGVKGISYIGVLRYYEENGKIDKINVYAGSSAGSFASLMTVLGYTSSEMLDEFVQTNIKELFGGNITSIPNLPRTILTSWRQFGITDGKAFEDKIKGFIGKKTGNPLITFLELYQLTGKTLIVTGSCLNTDKVEYFHWKTTPNFPVYKAVRISQNLPPVIAPVIITVKRHYTTSDTDSSEVLVEELWCDDELLCRNHQVSDLLPEMATFEKWYVDGGLLDNYPVEYTCKFTGSRKTVAGFDIDSLSGGDPQKRNKVGYTTISRKTPWDYLKSVIFAQHVELERISRSCEDYWDITIPLVVDDIDIYDFNLNTSQIQQLYQDGYNSTVKYYQKKQVSEHSDDESLSTFESRIKINVTQRKPSQIPKPPYQSDRSEWDSP
jgi:predicted acylesterase/phospholipase RssA